MSVNMNLDYARANMLKQQLRTWHVLEPSILALIANTPRERFVPKGYEKLAFADTEIPVGEGRSMMSPKEEARILQELAVKPSDKILLIGVDGSYLMTLLSKLAQQVYAVESDSQIRSTVEANIKKDEMDNVTLLDADIYEGWQEHAPFDVVILSGSVSAVPDHLFDSLAVGGRLFAVVGEKPVMSATFYQRAESGALKEWRLYETVRPRVPHFKETGTFEF